MNRAAHPPTEIVIVECAFPLAVQVLQDFNQITVVEAIVTSVAEKPHDVFTRYKAILVHIKVEESLADGDPSFLEAISQDVR